MPKSPDWHFLNKTVTFILTNDSRSKHIPHTPLLLIKVRTKTVIRIAKIVSYHYGQFKGILTTYPAQNFPLKKGVMKSEIRLLNCSANNHLLSVITFTSLGKFMA